MLPEIKDFIQNEEKKRAAHKKELEEKEGLQNHPKADLLYSLAWEYGHYCGYEEVELYYHRLVELLK